jgi:hypothetical protein
MNGNEIYIYIYIQTCSADITLSKWRPQDLATIKQASDQYTQTLLTNTPNGLQYAHILEKYNAYPSRIGSVWRDEVFPYGCNRNERASDYDSLFPYYGKRRDID